MLFFTAAGGVFLFDFKTVNVKHFPIFLFRWHQKTKTCNFMTQRWIKSVWALTYVRLKGLITEGVICSPGGNTFLCLCRFGKLMTCYNRAKFDSTVQWTWAGGLLLNHSAISYKMSHSDFISADLYIKCGEEKADFTNFVKSSPIFQFLPWTKLHNEVRTICNQYLI